MDKIIITAAMEKELAPFLSYWDITPDIWHEIGGGQVLVSFTGVGVVAATFHIQRLIHLHRPDRIIQAGVCGCYADSGLEVGQTVTVGTEKLADLGVMFDDGFRSIFPTEQTITNPDIPLGTYRTVAANTVNTGCSPVVTADRNRSAAVESMEGYALFYVCTRCGVKFTELRTVSNMVSTDRSSWNMPLATQNLATALTELLTKTE